MNAVIWSGKRAQVIREEDVDCTARPAAQRKSSLSLRLGLPVGRTAALPLVFALLILPLGLAVSAPAEPSKLTGEALRQAVSGKTVLIATPIGSLPIRYNSNGTMTGRAPAFVASLGTKRDRGQWWIADDRLCQRWYRDGWPPNNIASSCSTPAQSSIGCATTACPARRRLRALNRNTAAVNGAESDSMGAPMIGVNRPGFVGGSRS
jgi:hypothetical protein